MNVARLKYEIDSTQTKRASEDLKGMTKASKDADNAQKGLGSTSTRAGREVAAANDNISRSTDNLSASKGRYTKQSKAAAAVTGIFRDSLGKLRIGVIGVVAAIGTALVAAIAGFIRGVTEGTRAALAFNKSLIEVATLTKDAKENIDFLSASSIELSNQFGGTAQAQAQAFYQAISAGAGTAVQAQELLVDANKLAVAGVTTVANGVDVLTTAINAYGREALTTSQASDAIFVGVQQGKTTVAELSAGLGNVIPIASALGVEFEQLVSATAALTTQGQTTSVAITGIRSILTTIAKPTSEAAELAQKLGIEFNTTALRAQGLNGFLQGVIEQTGGSQDALAKLFGSVEALNAVLAFSGGAGEKFNNILGEMAQKTGATDAAFATVSESLSGRYDKSVAQIGNSFLQIGQKILPAVVGGLELFASAMQSVTSFVVDSIDKMVIEFTFVKDVISAAFTNIPSAISIGIIASMDAMVNLVLEGLNTILTPMNAVISGLNRISGTSFDNITFDSAGTNFQGLLDSFGGQVGQGADAYLEAIRRRDASLQAITNRNTDFGASPDDAFANNNLASPLAPISVAANDNASAFQNVESAATSAGEAVNKAANDNIDPWSNLRDSATQAGDEINKVGREIAGNFISDFKAARESGESFWDAIATAGTKALDKITDKLLNDVLDALFQVNKAGSGQGGGGAGGILGSLFGSLFGGGNPTPLPSVANSIGGGTGAPITSSAGAAFSAQFGAAFANGAAFSNGNVIPFANGGVVSSPTLFPMSGGRTGLMGEAGEEAIMPLTRDSGGRLGVRASGGSQSQEAPRTVVNIQNFTGANVETNERNEGGVNIQDIVIGEVNRGISNGQSDESMSRFGVKPQPRRVG